MRETMIEWYPTFLPKFMGSHLKKKMKNKNFVSSKLSKPTYYIYKQTASLKTKPTCKTVQAFIVYLKLKTEYNNFQIQHKALRCIVHILHLDPINHSCYRMNLHIR